MLPSDVIAITPSAMHEQMRNAKYQGGDVGFKEQAVARGQQWMRECIVCWCHQWYAGTDLPLTWVAAVHMDC